MVKKILVPGAGYGQEPVIKKAKELGFHVIVVSPQGDYPGLKYADKHYTEDVRNKEKLLKIAQDEKIDGIVSDQNDIPVETIGYIVDNLNLTGNSYKVSKVFSRKHLMRKKCSELGVPAISFFNVKSIESAIIAANKIGYPVIIKPVDNQSSKGVFKANSDDELNKFFDQSISFSFTNEVIVEQFINGTEFCVEGLAINGEYKNLLMLERTYFQNIDIFVPSMVTSPVSLSLENQEQLLDLNHKICTGFGIENGLTHAEYLLNEEDNQFYLVEVAARGGGVFISSHLISYACGFDTSELLVRMALGERLTLSDYRFSQKAVRYICFYIEDGRLIRINGANNIKKMENVILFYDDTLKPGKKFEGLKDKSSRLGPICVGANSIEEIYSTTEKIKKVFSVDTNNPFSKVIWE